MWSFCALTGEAGGKRVSAHFMSLMKSCSSHRFSVLRSLGVFRGRHLIEMSKRSDMIESARCLSVFQSARRIGLPRCGRNPLNKEAMWPLKELRDTSFSCSVADSRPRTESRSGLIICSISKSSRDLITFAISSFGAVRCRHVSRSWRTGSIQQAMNEL